MKFVFKTASTIFVSSPLLLKPGSSGYSGSKSTSVAIV